ncbi:hypothetical protein BV898_13877 [Hypsibius exemplaris]|uniref:Uncharacterized protein n=1 Tax=Hypsibius exemplaris TaxID=2072580 RepID=A0A1W0W9D4_HYPEX|nr:hypothetical protein BV898_13877 [Hypsibius exemplaris]
MRKNSRTTLCYGPIMIDQCYCSSLLFSETADIIAVDSKTRKDGRTDKGTVGWIDGGTDGRTDGWTDRRTDGWTDGGMVRRTDGRMDGRRHGRKDGGTVKRIDGGTGDGRTKAQTAIPVPVDLIVTLGVIRKSLVVSTAVVIITLVANIPYRVLRQFSAANLSSAGFRVWTSALFALQQTVSPVVYLTPRHGEGTLRNGGGSCFSGTKL